ncbi:MFS transporter [Phytoactinopolyspora alkaliphila]|uniref:MFS transporter n=1 Tax=Phytoactinopolyspora alkaliphila TaxID=1783498 RepID=A0A6N9YL57_9ACTN|nr:MFS transporter [Phytoactinopolyspora alkaliphila]NED95723.1 MFS transporter [Phytoactinopolyspora alkaliphila]
MSSSPASYRDVFAVREFRWLWLAHVLSVVGDQLARVAITILVYQRTESAGLTALTYALTYVPDVVGGATLAGLADRFPRRRVMVVTDLGRAVLLALMALPSAPLAAQAALLVLVRLFAAPFSSARQAALPDMLAGDRLTLGLGVISITYQGGLVVGFGAGAALVAELGISTALLINAGTFIGSAVVIHFGLSLYRPAPHPTDHVLSQWKTIKAGWAVVASDARLRSLMAIACCSGFYVVPEGLAVPYAAQIGAGTATVGWLLAANPIGTVIGMVILRRISPPRRLVLMGPLAVCSSLVLLPTGWAPSVVITVTLWTASGIFSAHDMVTQATYVQIVPAHRRGQAIGVAIAALRAAQGLAIIVAGMLAQFLPPATIIAFAAVLGTLAAAVATARWRRSASSRAIHPPRDETGEDVAS